MAAKFEYAMLDDGPFSPGTSRWFALGKVSEEKFSSDQACPLFINPGGIMTCSGSNLRYTKTGMAGNWPRYTHTKHVYQDIVIRPVPLQNATVNVNVIQYPQDGSVQVEAYLDGHGVVYSKQFMITERLQASKVHNCIIKFLNTGGHVSCNTKLKLSSFGTNIVLKGNALLWVPARVRAAPKAKARRVMRRPAAA